MTNTSFDINKTNNHIKHQHIRFSAITFTGYAQSQKMVFTNIEIFGIRIHKSKKDGQQNGQKTKDKQRSTKYRK